MLNVCYFFVLNVHLGDLLFMKFNVTENIVNTQNIFSTRKVLNVCYFFVLNVHLGDLLFMKFNATENIEYCLSHFICSKISIYTYSSA